MTLFIAWHWFHHTIHTVTPFEVFMWFVEMASVTTWLISLSLRGGRR